MNGAASHLIKKGEEIMPYEGEFYVRLEGEKTN